MTRAVRHRRQDKSEHGAGQKHGREPQRLSQVGSWQRHQEQRGKDRASISALGEPDVHVGRRKPDLTSHRTNKSQVQMTSRRQHRRETVTDMQKAGACRAGAGNDSLGPEGSGHQAATRDGMLWKEGEPALVRSAEAPSSHQPPSVYRPGSPWSPPTLAGQPRREQSCAHAHVDPGPRELARRRAPRQVGRGVGRARPALPCGHEPANTVL